MRHSTRRGLAVASAMAITAMALTGCTSAESDDAASGDFTPLTDIKLQLQWLPQAQFAGYYVALDQGYFEDEGFDNVEIIPSGGDIIPQDALVAGDVDFAVAWVPKVLGTLESGVELTDIAQVFQKSGTLQVSFAGDGIESVSDFEGKRIGSWGFGNEWEIFAAMAAEGLDSSSVSITTQGFDMNALLNGDVDAAQATTYNEWAQVLETVNPDTGELYQPEDFDVVSYEDTEGGMYQDALWADTAKLNDDPAYADAAVRFLKAVTKGWVYSRDNPEEAAAIVYDAATSAELAYPVGPTHQLWMMNEVNKLIWAGGDFGVVDPALWDKTVKGALSATNQDGLPLITAEPADSAYSNKYIEQALKELAAEGIVVDGEYTPIDVVLTEGGK